MQQGNEAWPTSNWQPFTSNIGAACWRWLFRSPLDDQLLINGEQFATLVRMHKQGASVAVSVIREARHIQVTVRLGEKETSSASPPNADAAADLSRVAYANTLNDALSSAAVNWRKQVIFDSNVADNLVSVARTGPVTLDDGKTIAVLQRAGGQSLLAAFDRSSGKLVFSGPVNNEQQWKGVPDELRQKLNNWRGLTGTDLLEIYGNGTFTVGNGTMSLSGQNIVVGSSNAEAQKQPATQPADKK